MNCKCNKKRRIVNRALQIISMGVSVEQRDWSLGA